MDTGKLEKELGFKFSYSSEAAFETFLHTVRKN
jgi:hypothetical protein